MVYFMMQISMIAAATCAAGSFTSNKSMIRSGGWCALIGLTIAFFSYAINKPIAVMVEESVAVMVKADNDMAALTPEEREMPLVQILAYCKPPDEESDSSGFDLSFATDLAAMIDPNAAASAATPAAVKLSIETATNTMDATLKYFQSSPDLIRSMGNSVDLLPIVNYVFDAVNNIIT
jgi:hypothetical protein